MSFLIKMVSIKSFWGCVLILFDLFGFTFGYRKKHWI
nr:MAG TPA: hypothetical protein [Caudoviricetes sp.]